MVCVPEGREKHRPQLTGSIAKNQTLDHMEREGITTHHEERDQQQAKAGGSGYDDLSTQQLKDLLKGAGVNAAGAERKEELIALAHVHRIDPSIVAHKRARHPPPPRS